MKEEKNIDRLFQEKFKDFEMTPSGKVWKNIEAELNQKKKRRVIPFWYKIAGVAALIALLFIAGNILFSSKEAQVVNQENGKKLIEERQNKTNSEVKTTQNSVLEEEQNNIVFEENTSEKVSTSNERSTIVSEKANAKNSALSEKNTTNQKSIKSFTQSEDVNHKLANNQNKEQIFSETKKERIANRNLKEPIEGKNEITENITAVSSENNAENELEEEIVESENALALVEKQKNEEKENDEKDKKTTENTSKFEVKPMISSIYYGNLSSSGNTLDPNFSNNAGDGKMSMSYGVNFAYVISEKLKVRTGVNKINLRYETHDIAFSSSVNPVALRNVTPINTSENLDFMVTSSSQLDNRPLNPTQNGVLQQQIGFIEVPVELQYSLLDKKFGINVIGGASSLFLNNNHVAIESTNGTTEVGEANNLNNVSFSTNIGLGFDYDLSKKINLNLEPIFKYQLNTFSESTNGFKPYNFGVYTGLNFKF
ncbi:hypothetical protein [Mesonia sp. K7]|uniref:hypothetical protein n=1 Tax=Mesonia sp. K7 TaxID=2218606 RepID=UPI000DA71644|nr:hypothetical protein [Mesonia sp. K7]PZD77418.1 hypothetical protein DNG35_08865 [Mesonia sp. K7]